MTSDLPQPPLPIAIEEEKLRQRFRKSLLVIYSVPCMAFFALLMLGAFSSGDDFYHDQTVHSWDMLRMISVALMTQTSALIICLGSFRWVRRIANIGWMKSFFPLGCIFSLFAAVLNYAAWQGIDAFLFFKVVQPNQVHSIFQPRTSLPNAAPTFSLNDILVITAVFAVICIPTSLIASIYINRKAPKYLAPNHKSA
jgi:hypothetical protein